MRKIFLAITALSVLFVPFAALADTVPGNVLITAVQVTGGTGQTQEDFIELFNPGDVPFNLNGHRLVKRSATGVTDSLIKSWTEDTFIPPHSFFLWANSGFLEISAQPDLVNSATLSDNNGVAVRFGPSDTGTIIDSVAWGNATNSFHNVSSENPGADLSLQRQDLFVVDSVFSIGTSAPRNSTVVVGPPLPPSPVIIDNAVCQSVVAPASVQTNEVFNVRTIFTNSGTSTWLTDGSYRLQPLPVGDFLPSSQETTPSSSALFDVTITAPDTSQQLSLSWQLSHSGALFGEICNASILVEAPTPPLPPPPSPSPLVKISEVLSNPTGTDPGNEVVELYNSDSQPVDLSGWILDDDPSSTTIGDSAYTLPDLVINPGQYLAISIPGGKFSLNNSSADGVRLFFPSSTLADSVTYPADGPEGKSYQKIISNWQWATPTLGAANAVDVTPPVTPPPITPPPPVPSPIVNAKDILLTEIYAFPGPQEDEFIELYNNTTQSVSLHQLFIRIGNSKKQLPEVTLGAGQFLALEPDEFPGHLRNAGNVVSVILANNAIIDQVEYGKSKKEESLALTNTKTWQWTEAPTPGESNQFNLAVNSVSGEKAGQLPKPIVVKNASSNKPSLVKQAAASAVALQDNDNSGSPPLATVEEKNDSKRKALVYSSVVGLGLVLLAIAWKFIPRHESVIASQQPFI